MMSPDCNTSDFFYIFNSFCFPKLDKFQTNFKHFKIFSFFSKLELISYGCDIQDGTILKLFLLVMINVRKRKINLCGLFWAADATDLSALSTGLFDRLDSSLTLAEVGIAGLLQTAGGKLAISCMTCKYGYPNFRGTLRTKSPELE